MKEKKQEIEKPSESSNKATEKVANDELKQDDTKKVEILSIGYNSPSDILNEALPMLQMVVNQKVKLVEAVKVRYPGIESEVAEKFVDTLFTEIMERFYKGEEISFLKHLPDGSVVLTPFTIEKKTK